MALRRRPDESGGAYVFRISYYAGALPGFPPEKIFLYGPLADPKVLKRVVGLEEEPVLEDATISHVVMRMWGEHPALVLTRLPSDPLTEDTCHCITLDARPPPIEGKKWVVPHPKYHRNLVEHLGLNYLLYRVGFRSTTTGEWHMDGMTWVWWGDMAELMDSKGNRVLGFEPGR